MNKRLLLLPAVLISCAPAVSESQTSPPIPVAAVTVRYNMTCSSVLFQLFNASIGLNPFPKSDKRSKFWNDLLPQQSTFTELVLTSQRKRLVRPNPWPNSWFAPNPIDDSRLVTVKAICSDENRTAILNLSSTGLSADVMNNLNARLLSGVTEF